MTGRLVRSLVIGTILGCLMSTGCATPRSGGEPQVVYHGGNVYTFNPRQPRAAAIAVRDGRIVAIGSDSAVLALAGEMTRRVPLAGRTVTPGLIDAHVHMSWLGSVKTGRLNLAQVKSFDELIDLVKERAAETPKGEWVLGSLWDNASWGMKAFPTHERLSAAVPDHPVWLGRNDGHMALANARAMALAGITRDTPDPTGGEILRDADGNATGLFVDNAMELMGRVVPRDASVRDDLLAAQDACLALGITGVHDAGISPAEIDVYKRLADAGALKLRVYGMIHAESAIEYISRHKPLIGYADGRFTLRAVKCFADGAMSTRGAWLFAPYSDRPGYVGLPVQNLDWIGKITRASLDARYQVCTHAIGDRAIHEILNLYETAITSHPKLDHRLRVEHAQNPAFADIARFAALDVIPSMQPVHATSDMRWAEDRVGPERVTGAYAWAKFLRAGCRIAAGSDCPVEDPNPLWGVYAAVTRQDQQGHPPGGWYPDECMTREEAFRAFTLDAAYSAFEEHDKGTLEPGKLADFTVYDRDVLRCPARELVDTKVHMTVINGEIVYESEPRP